MGRCGNAEMGVRELGSEVRGVRWRVGWFDSGKRRWSRFLVLCVLVGVGVTAGAACRAQSGFDDDRVMLQGFYWESHRHGYPDRFPQFGEKKWYEIVREAAPEIRAGRFDMVWLPPPSYAGEMSAGY